MSATKFQELRNRWVECVHGDDRHSLSRQIGIMVWHAATFRVVNEARRLAPSAIEGGVQLNAVFHEFINHGFFVSQVVAIRRLLDTYPLLGNRGVFSLRGTITDMAKHAPLFTRAHLLEAEGLKFDYSDIRRAHDDYQQQQLAAGVRSYGIPKHLDWEVHERRHKQIDWLVGTNGNERTRDDVIRDQIFNRLLNKLGICDNVLRYVDKFIAHAATPESRSTTDPKETEVTLGHLWTAHQAIGQVCGFVSIYLLGGPQLGFLATPQFDQFRYMENPLVTTEKIPQIRTVWDDYATQIDDWSAWGPEAFDREFHAV